MIFLPDVNVLIALVDPAHLHHEIAHEWFARNRNQGWATCPLTENGVIRIISHKRYPNSLECPSTALHLVRSLCSLPEHVFWPDHISLLDQEKFNTDYLITSQDLTDCYLLALACAHNGQLVTFDRKIATKSVKNGEKHLIILS